MVCIVVGFKVVSYTKLIFFVVLLIIVWIKTNSQTYSDNIWRRRMGYLLSDTFIPRLTNKMEFCFNHTSGLAASHPRCDHCDDMQISTYISAISIENIWLYSGDTTTQPREAKFKICEFSHSCTAPTTGIRIHKWILTILFAVY